MQQEIKNLRISIDGIAKLVRDLKPKKKFIVDISMIPKEMGIEKFITNFENSGYALIDSTLGVGEKDSKFNAFSIIPIKDEEINKCYDCLILGKAWLGKILGELGSETPYKNDGNRKTVKDIEKTSDTFMDGEFIIPTSFSEMSHIEKVDWVRQEIQRILETLPSGLENLDKTDLDRNFRILTFMSYFNKYMSEARFWLGFELQRIKEESYIEESK